MSFLRKGNLAMSQGQIKQALAHFRSGLTAQPELSTVYALNIHRALLNSKPHAERLRPWRIGICVWEMSHNPAGRGLALAEAYQYSGRVVPVDVELLGPCYQAWGGKPWGPLQEHPIVSHTFQPEQFGDDDVAIYRAYYHFVKKHPKDIVHLIKPRGPALLMGLLYQEIHQATVIFDCDDEELGFFKQGKDLVKLEHSIGELADSDEPLPPLRELPKKIWTHVSIYLMHCCSALTVSNPALHKRYGGTLIPHSRAAEDYMTAPEARVKTQIQARQRLGVPADAVVILFSGTPRKHKGLEQTARALRAVTPTLKFRPLLVVVGDFPDRTLRTELEGLLAEQLILIPGQPYKNLATVAALGDLAVLWQGDDVVSQFQVPAKLTEALAVGMIVLMNRQPSLEIFLSGGAAIEVAEPSFESKLKYWLNEIYTVKQGAKSEALESQVQAGKDYFEQHLSHKVTGNNLLNVAFRAYLDNMKTGQSTGVSMPFTMPGEKASASEFTWYAKGVSRNWVTTQVLREDADMRISQVTTNAAAEAVEKVTKASKQASLEGWFYLAMESRTKQAAQRAKVMEKVELAFNANKPQLKTQGKPAVKVTVPRLLEFELNQTSCRLILEKIDSPSVSSIGELGDYRMQDLGVLLWLIAQLRVATHSEAQYLHSGQGTAVRPLKLPIRSNQLVQENFQALLNNTSIQYLFEHIDSMHNGPGITANGAAKLKALVEQVVSLTPRVNRYLKNVQLVFSHNDLNRGNVFYNAETKTFIVIDWATVSLSPVGSELAQLIHPSFWTKTSTIYGNVKELEKVEQSIIHGMQCASAEGPGTNGVGYLTSEDIWVGYITRLLTQQLLLHLPRYAAYVKKKRDFSGLQQVLKKLDVFAIKLSKLADFVK